MYRGVGARGLETMPSPMYLANVDCIGCHLEKRTDGKSVSHAQTLMGTEKGCTECHGPEYLGVLPEAQKLIDDASSAIRKNLVAVQGGLAALPEGETAPGQLSDAVKDAAYNLAFVDRSHSVHNVYYAAHILREVDTSLTKAARQLKVKVEKTSKLPIISGEFCGALCHPKMGVKVPAEKVKFRGKEMPHRDHLEEGLSCVSCHTFGAHKDVKLKGTKKCMTCHEEDDFPAEGKAEGQAANQEGDD